MFKNRPQLSGTVVGLVVTIICTIYLLGFSGDHSLEYLAYNERVRRCNTLTADPSIVHVDIDDGALEKVGRWPWQRDRVADLIRTIHELGAANIMVDLLFTEPEQPFVDNPSAGMGIDAEMDVATVGKTSDRNRVYGDGELADAIRTAGNVILSSQLDVRSPVSPDPLAQCVAHHWEKNEPANADVNSLIAACDLDNTATTRKTVLREILRQRIIALLKENYTLTEKDVAQKLNADLSLIAEVFAGAKQYAAQLKIESVFKSKGDNSLPPLKTAVAETLGADQNRWTADLKDILNAYRIQRGLEEMARKAFRPLPDMRERFYRATTIVPVYYELSAPASGLAAVNFQSDDGGVVRRVPIVVECRGKVVPHMGLAAAAKIRDLDLDNISQPNAHTLLIPQRGTEFVFRLPLDGDGNLLIPWTRTGPRWRQGGDFEHVTATKVWSIVEARRNIRENETKISYLLADVIAASKNSVTVVDSVGKGDGTKLLVENEYRKKVNEQLSLEDQAKIARLFGKESPEKIADLQRRAAEALAEIQSEQKNAISNVEMAYDEIKALSQAEIDADPELKNDASRFQKAYKLIHGDIAALERANEGLQFTVNKTKEELQPRIKGKYIFLGYAATASGDIVSTPIDHVTNGVICHANVLNAFLQNRFIRPAPRWAEITICMLLGTVVSLITSRKNPWAALTTTLSLNIAFVIVNTLVLFRQYDIWFDLVGITVTSFVAWAFVTLFRQLTAERDKRHFRKQLSQYTSPAIAAKIAESQEAAAAFKAVQTRDVTCFFSDLKGFTSITEREDAEVVQYVLNSYLERMCRVIWGHRGLINKFMGDGIMAFFNPSVDPLPDHTRVACDSALDAIGALDQLRTEKASGNGADIFKKLEMRVGIATGRCKNGDFGSELKADYTVIGDVVNLAARLEPANKVFGTSIMVSGPVRDHVRDHYEFRYLAELQVKGKAQTVPAYEMICRKGGLSDEQRNYVERFEAGVELYKNRRWDECIVHFTRMLSRRPDDLGASRYISACQEFKGFPPDDDWRGALELKEK